MAGVVDWIAPEGGWVRDTLRRHLLEPKVPAHLRKRFRPLDQAGKERLQKSLRENFFGKHSAAYLDTPVGMQDFAEHLTGRLERDRRQIVPWLDEVRRLADSRILEIGCGTGASTIALAEQGAKVVGVDVDAVALKDATERSRIYDLDVSFVNANGADVGHRFSHGQFDIIVFYASLEHMTHAERLVALASSWALLLPGGALGIVDTPNRLWYFDSHTALTPFFHWLPDDVAVKYSRFCPRNEFNKVFSELNDRSYTDFMRWGRGVSFHELEIAINDIDLLRFVSCASNFARRQRLLSRLKWKLSQEGTYARFISKLRRDVHSGFFQPYLNVVLVKQAPTVRSSAQPPHRRT